MISRRNLISIAASAPFAAPALAQDPPWPRKKRVTMVVPYGPGTAPDNMTRIISEAFAEKFGQTFVVENRVGVGGNLGVSQVTKAEPDGYTFVVAPVGGFAINEFLYEKPLFSPRDLAPVSTVYEVPNVFVVSGTNPAKNLKEYVAFLKKRDKSLTFGSPGIGNSAHLWGELFRGRIGMPGVHTPFASGTQTIVSILQGDVDFTIDVMPTYVGNIQSGKLKALAVTGSTRSHLLPDVPTMAEAGFPGFDLTTWVALAAPAKTPPAILKAMSDAQVAIAQAPLYRGRFAAAGVRMASSTPEELTARIERERPRWGELVKASGATIK
ncbi:MAG: tripartite tricarboxylate transporter substrate-binding protein [Pseudomonadota bacterium]